MAEQLPENEVTALYQHLKCSLCKEFYIPPIFICKSGHNFCNNCQSNMKHCHECYRDRTYINNLTLEKVITTISLPCPFAQFGCKMRMRLSERENHVMGCNFTPFRCPIYHCSERVGFNTIVDHLHSEHRITEVDAEEDPEGKSLSFHTTLNGYPDNYRALIVKSQSLGMFLFRKLRYFRDNMIYVLQTLSPVNHTKFRYIIKLAQCGPAGEEFTFCETPQPLNRCLVELMQFGKYMVVNGRLNDIKLSITIEERCLFSSQPPGSKN